MLVLLRLALFFAVISGGAQIAQAQAQAPDPAAAAQALIEALRDDTARAALIGELERIGGAPAADEAAGAPRHAAARVAAAQVEEPAPRSLGAVLAAATIGIVDQTMAAMTDFRNGLSATWRRLSLLGGSRGGDLVVTLVDLAALIAVTAGVFIALRLLANRGVARLNAMAADAPPARRAGLFLGTAIVHLAPAVGAWATGYVIAVAFFGEAGRIGLNESLYLNAFIVVEASRTLFRLVLQPRAPHLRLLPMTDATARAWRRRFGVMASILGYGVLLVTPLVAQTVSIFTARAVEVIVFGGVLLIALVLVIRHRRDPLEYLNRRDNGDQADTARYILKVVALVWHWVAVAWLLVVAFDAVTQGGSNVENILIGTGRVLAVLTAGVVAHLLLGRIAQRGVTVPESFGEQAQMVEDRLNDFIRRIAGVARVAALAIAVGLALEVSGGAPVASFLAGVLGADFGARLASAALVVTFAFGVWVALASWVDYKLDPGRRVAANARERTLLVLMRNAVTVAVAVISAMIALSELGLDIGPLLASAGVLGLAIGFGAQRLVQDIITGVFIQLENAINVGDVVTVSGTTGVVEKLTIRSVALRDLTGTFHIIPFSSVDMVSNFMRGFAFHVAEMGIAYREDVAEAKRLMFEAFDDLRADPDHAREIIGPLEWHGVTAFADSAVMVRARIRTRPGSQWGVGRAYNEMVKRRFDAAGVEIPFPHMTLWFGEDKTGKAPPMRVAAATAAAAAAGAALAPAEPPSPRPAQDAPNEEDDAA
ncbi:MAG: mechanosensitive ion channel protein MscS [Rhodobacteraceae bacterium]|nr:MAG: mechanosensitive ion channel protein MscS [Paracoccaceae bacterium]